HRESTTCRTGAARRARHRAADRRRGTRRQLARGQKCTRACDRATMPPRRGTRDRRGRALPRHRARSASRTFLASGRRFAVRRRAWPLIVFRRQVDRTARAPYRAVLTATDPGGRSTAKPVLVAFTIVVDRKARP